jgi:transcriptional regulator with XRE-family HTH domain
MKPGMKIKFLRISKGMTQGELAKRIGATQAVMSRIEGGKREPTLKELQQISKIFEVDIASVIADDDSLSGLDAMYRRGDLRKIAERGGNLGEAQEASVSVPVFDIEGGYTISFDDGGYPVGYSGKRQALSPSEAAGPNFFGCDLHGDSMQQSGEPSFKEGDRLFFDPSLDVRNGGFAFVRAADDTATFKQVFFDTEQTIRLHPLNSRYPDTTLPRKQVMAMWPLVFRIQRFS